MKRAFVMAFLAVGLSSCALTNTVATVTGFRVTEDKANIAIATSVGAERTAQHVLQLPICAQGKRTVIDGCVTVADGDAIIKYTRGLQAARNSLLTAVRSDPDGASAYQLYKAVTAATAQLKAASGATS